VTALAFQRPQPMNAVRFEAHMVGHCTGRTYPLGSFDDFDACMADVLHRCSHKDTLFIRRIEDGAETLSVYQIKQRSKPVYVYRDHVQRRVQPLYADHLCDFAVPGVGE
jgi:hypothetical protein